MMVQLGGSVVRVLTMNDIEAFYSGLASHPFFNLGDMFEIVKAAGEVSTARGVPYWNTVYGLYVWMQLNTEANVFGMLPKTTWPRSGWRMQKAYAAGEYNRGGFNFSDIASRVSTTETGAIPGPIYPEIVVARTKPGIATISFEVSDIMEALARTSIDDIWGTTEQMKLQMGTEFIKLINSMIARKVIGNATDGSDTEGVTATTVEGLSGNIYSSAVGNLIESIDRVVSSSEEASAYGNANAANIYSIDRTSETWANAIVKYNTSGQDLTDDLIRQTLVEARSKGANTNVILTGWDTYAKLQGLYMTFVRYVPMMETRVQFGLNGIQTAQGENVGIQVSALYDIPVIVSNDVPSDGSDKLQRIYMLDTSDFEGYGMPRLSISVLRPVEYFETRDFVLLGKFVVKGVYRMVGQLTARYLPGQAKIRDLKA